MIECSAKSAYGITQMVECSTKCPYGIIYDRVLNKICLWNHTNDRVLSHVTNGRILTYVILFTSALRFDTNLEVNIYYQ